jgi:hypothetical protein
VEGNTNNTSNTNNTNNMNNIIKKIIEKRNNSILFRDFLFTYLGTNKYYKKTLITYTALQDISNKFPNTNIFKFTFTLNINNSDFNSTQNILLSEVKTKENIFDKIKIFEQSTFELNITDKSKKISNLKKDNFNKRFLNSNDYEQFMSSSKKFILDIIHLSQIELLYKLFMKYKNNKNFFVKAPFSIYLNLKNYIKRNIHISNIKVNDTTTKINKFNLPENYPINNDYNCAINISLNFNENKEYIDFTVLSLYLLDFEWYVKKNINYFYDEEPYLIDLYNKVNNNNVNQNYKTDKYKSSFYNNLVTFFFVIYGGYIDNIVTNNNISQIIITFDLFTYQNFNLIGYQVIDQTLRLSSTQLR